MLHKPVLLEETVRSLNLKPGAVVVDGTLGSGGHAQEILKHIGPRGRLIAVDQDPESIKRCSDLFKNDVRVTLHVENFLNLDTILDFVNVSAADAVILDVGLSSDQLGDPARGFSFEQNGPLDMRMSPEAAMKASDLINDLPERELERIFREYGEEYRASRFVRSIVREREKRRIETGQDLIDAIQKVLPFDVRKGHRPSSARRHPATKVFQALRIAVNRELDVLKEGLPRIWKRIAPGGRLAVISFHSLEDRIVKHQFRDWAQKKEGSLIYKKPVIAGEIEMKENPRSRSAKLRVIEKAA